MRLKPKYDRKLREDILRETEKVDEFRELLGQLQKNGRFLIPAATLGAVGGAEVEHTLLRNIPTSAVSSHFVIFKLPQITLIKDRPEVEYV